MAVNIARIVVGADWTLLNSTDAVQVQFQAQGAGQVKITRGGATAPADDAPGFDCDPKFGRDPAAIDDVMLAPAGARFWARSLNGAVIVIAWTTA